MFSNYATSSVISSNYNPTNTFILRLGSCPTSKGSSGYRKEDNFYQEWISGSYRKHIEKSNTPFKNIIHNYITEIQPMAIEWKTTPAYSHINGINEVGKFEIDDEKFDPKTDPIPTHLTVDFNSTRFNSKIYQLMADLGNLECLFDCIITDDRTTKFLHTTGLSNLIALLNIGGIAIFTDLDEDYEWQFDGTCMFHKQTKEIFQKFINQEKISIHDLHASRGEKYGLFDLVFGDCADGKEIDSEYLKHYQIKITSDIKLKVQFYKNIFEYIQTLCTSSSPLKDIFEYLLHLGNGKSSKEKSRIIMLERIA